MQLLEIMADDKEEAIRLAVEQCEQTQYMVDISAMKLSELRRCEGDLFKKELCEVEVSFRRSCVVTDNNIFVSFAYDGAFSLQ